jgi:hypothetical protein
LVVVVVFQIRKTLTPGLASYLDLCLLSSWDYSQSYHARHPTLVSFPSLEMCLSRSVKSVGYVCRTFFLSFLYNLATLFPRIYRFVSIDISCTIIFKKFFSWALLVKKQSLSKD